jgi:hypothetical protein
VYIYRDHAVAWEKYFDAFRAKHPEEFDKNDVKNIM